MSECGLKPVEGAQTFADKTMSNDSPAQHLEDVPWGKRPIRRRISDA
jgi:hypothetical protein